MTIIRRLNFQLLVAATLVAPGAALHAQQPGNTPATAPAAAKTPAAAAQPGESGPPNAVQGFSQNRDQPVHIESATLEVHDKDKVAIFSGNVHVTQGDTTMRCKALHVFYEQNVDTPADKKAKDDKAATTAAPAATAAKSGQPATPAPGGQQSIKRMEAHGGVVVTQKDQVANGDLGVYDPKANTVVLTGNVSMTQGQNVIRGDRLIVDLTTNTSRVESGKGGSARVQGLLFPGNNGPDLPKPGQLPGSPQTPKPAAAPAAAPSSN